jgi:hypothetical protein
MNLKQLEKELSDIIDLTSRNNDLPSEYFAETTEIMEDIMEKSLEKSNRENSTFNSRCLGSNEKDSLLSNTSTGRNHRRGENTPNTGLEIESVEQFKKVQETMYE